MKSRLQALGLLDRAIRSTTDDELAALAAGLSDDHREALERLAGGTDAESVRAAVARGRIDGTMESITLVLTDAALDDCIKQLGDHADHPSSDQLRAVLPGVVDRHGLGATRMMLAATVAGEAAAAAVIRDLLKNDELVKLPPVEQRPPGMTPQEPQISDVERDAIRAKRQELKQRKQAEARARREQSARARGRT